MRDAYAFLTGPMVWVAFGVFILGSVYRIVSMYSLAKQKDASSLAYMDAKYSMRSILAWLTPFKAQGWKESPGLCLTTFVFHLCLVVVALFYSAHVVLWEKAFGIRLPSLPDPLADIMTALVIIACAIFLVRRLTQPLLQYVTTPMDWLVLAMTAAPFLTGLLATYQVGGYPLMSVMHVASGEVMLMALPFTRLSHALFAPFTRAYMGSEFGGVRHCIDW